MERYREGKQPQEGSALKRLFQQRQDMSNEKINTKDDIQHIESFIDINYGGIDSYIDDTPAETSHSEPFTHSTNYSRAHSADSNYDGRTLQSEMSCGWTYESDHVSMQKRTTSIHRNVVKRQSKGVKDLEDRRQWTSCAAIHNGRQDLEEHAQKILKYMLQDNSLTEDSPQSEQLRRDALKNMPQSVTVKKMIKRKFVSSISVSKAVGCFQMLKYQTAMWFSQIRGSIKNFLFTFELWYDAIKKIEGNFGSGVSSYFKFLRWLFVINVLMTVFSFCFISIPQIMFREESNSSRSNIDISSVNFELGRATDNTNFSPGDIFTGTGYFADTILYYGHYTHLKVFDVYDMPKAYFFTMVSAYLAVFMILSYSMARSYRKSFIETKGGLQNVFAHKIFCGWDYSIATRKAANLKSTSIYSELKELLADLDKLREEVAFCEKFRTFLMQLAAHIFAVAVAFGHGYLMYMLLRDSHDPVVVPAIVINIVMVFFPILFRLFASYEDYKNPKTALFVTLARTVLLELVVVGVLIYYWLKQAEKTSINCWENQLAQEMYRLLIFDFFFSTLFLTFVEVAWYIVHRTVNGVDVPEFDIATNTLAVIYNQTLFMVGFYFSPLLGVIVIIKLFLTWYIKSFIIMHCCQPPRKAWRAAQTESWFLIITFLWSLILLFVHGYHIINIDSSRTCGPFQIGTISSIININPDSEILKVLVFLLKPGVIAVILIGMSMGVYYLRAVAHAQIDMVSFLRNRLILAAKDKEFLLHNINDITKGQYKFHVPERREGGIDPSKLAPKVSENSVIDRQRSSDDIIFDKTTRHTQPEEHSRRY